MSKTTWSFGGGGREAGGHGSDERGTDEHGGGNGLGGRFRLPAPPRARLMLVAPVTADREAFPVAATVAGRAAVAGRPVLLAELRSGRRRSGLFSTSLSRGVADLVRARFRELDPQPRGPFCHAGLPADAEAALPMLRELPEILPEQGLCVVAMPPASLRRLVETESLAIDAVVLVAELPAERALTALACGDLSDRGIRCRVWKLPLSAMRARLAALGLPPGGEAATVAARLLAGLEARDAE